MFLGGRRWLGQEPHNYLQSRGLQPRGVVTEGWSRDGMDGGME